MSQDGYELRYLAIFARKLNYTEYYLPVPSEVSGAEKITDVVKRSTSERNLELFNDLVEIFKSKISMYIWEFWNFSIPSLASDYVL
jgi:hypothetical protein